MRTYILCVVFNFAWKDNVCGKTSHKQHSIDYNVDSDFCSFILEAWGQVAVFLSFAFLNFVRKIIDFLEIMYFRARQKQLRFFHNFKKCEYISLTCFNFFKVKCNWIYRNFECGEQARNIQLMCYMSLQTACKLAEHTVSLYCSTALSTDVRFWVLLIMSTKIYLNQQKMQQRKEGNFKAFKDTKIQ